MEGSFDLSWDDVQRRHYTSGSPNYWEPPDSVISSYSTLAGALTPIPAKRFDNPEHAQTTSSTPSDYIPSTGYWSSTDASPYTDAYGSSVIRGSGGTVGPYTPQPIVNCGGPSAEHNCIQPVHGQQWAHGGFSRPLDFFHPTEDCVQYGARNYDQPPANLNVEGRAVGLHNAHQDYTPAQSPRKHPYMPNVDSDVTKETRMEIPDDGHERISRQGYGRDHKFACGLRIPNGSHTCGRSVSYNSCPEHVRKVHEISGNTPSKDGSPYSCSGCGKSGSLKNIARHIRTIHLGFRRKTQSKHRTESRNNSKLWSSF